MSDSTASDHGRLTKPLIVLSFDALATAAIGCYGSSWNQTPAIDTIATGGCVWDRWIATNDDSAAVLRRWFDGGDNSWADAWRGSGAVDLITDDSSIAADAKCFDRVTTLPPQATQQDAQPADEIETTQLASVIAAAVERDAEDEPWSVMWLHSNFLSTRWDAPRSLFPIDEIELLAHEADEEEVELIGNTEPARLVEPTLPIFETVTVPKLSLADSSDPDLVTSWMRTYGCQVRLIDLMIEILLQSISADDPQLIVVGTGGFSLGQNGWIGRGCGPLRSPEIRVPMIISDIGPIRMPQPSSDVAMTDILRDLSCGASPWASPKAWAARPSDVEIKTVSDRVEMAATTSSWFFVRDQDASEHLFLKPDDVEDFNDVGRLRLDVIDDFNGANTEDNSNNDDDKKETSPI
ncbi:hypothetical protein [Rubripirellula reticaptiva]|uniref:hypothetical protein n=1 Tax=Rubripirellula reticaptiva TaxID=2528013 RepID=UPI0011B621EA|nr:hypothetical protein [Rubripirellula reticaptiva]